MQKLKLFAALLVIGSSGVLAGCSYRGHRDHDDSYGRPAAYYERSDHLRNYHDRDHEHFEHRDRDDRDRDHDRY